MRRTHLAALLIVAATVAWLASGHLIGTDAVGEHPTIRQLNTGATAKGDEGQPIIVRGEIIRAASFVEQIDVRGHTENKRTVEVRTETQGRVVQRPVERGTAVATGDLLCQLAVDDRQARVKHASEAVEEARIEHEGSLRLKDGGFQSRTAIAQAKSRLAAAEAQLEAATLDYERDVHPGAVRRGRGAHPARGRRLRPAGHPLRHHRRPRSHAAGGPGVRTRGQSPRPRRVRPAPCLPPAKPASGTISFVGRQADAATRTYRVEATVPNPDHRLLSGTTADIVIPVGEVSAHRISPAVLALDDDGALSVRTVDHAGRVRSRSVAIVADSDDGVWVTGLPSVVTLITLGHQLVVDGDQVDVQLADNTEPAPGSRRVDAPAESDRRDRS